MDEVWANIKGYEGYYQISNIGRVKSLDRVVRCSNGRLFSIKGCIIKQREAYQGYSCVELTKGGKRKKYLVHRLLAEAFIPNPYNKPQIDHINTIRNDNRIENLRWVTPSENCLNVISRAKWLDSHSKMSDESKERYKQAYLRRRGKGSKISRAVSQYTKEGKHIKDWESAHWAGIELGIHSSTITRCANGERLTAGGYKWVHI